MSSDAELRAEARAARRSRRLPPGASCSVCGAHDPAVLSVKPGGAVRCYEHRDGDTPRVEADHIAGRANLPGLTVDLHANAHRRVTDLRRQLGLDELPPADGDPLLVLAHFAGGLAAVLALLAESLAALAEWVAARLGPRWWEQAPALPLA